MSGSTKPWRQRVLHAGSWTLVGYASVQLLRLTSSLLMTRLLAPEFFGIMSVAVAVSIIVYMLADVGIRQTVVSSSRGDAPEMLVTAWTMQIVRGFAIWGVSILVAIVLEVLRRGGTFAADSVYGTPELPWVIAATSFTSVIAGFTSTRSMLAERRLDQRKAALLEPIGLAVTIASMASMTLVSKSVWPLVFGGYVGALVQLALSHWWLEGRPDRLGWDKQCAKEITTFGRWIMLSSAMYVLSSNGDRILLGAWSTNAQMAYYYIALTLAQAAEVASTRVMMSVATPMLSEVARTDRERLPAMFWKVRIPMDIGITAVSGLLFALGHVIVAILYPPRFAAAGQVLEILAVMLLFVRYAVSGSAWMALGTTKYLTMVSFARMIAIFVMVPVGYRLGGLDGAYWAIALHVGLSLPVVWFCNRKHGLWSWPKELALLAVWPVAYGVGWALARLWASFQA
jgi:O-antigen/teichoic acid export membrane protein